MASGSFNLTRTGSTSSYVSFVCNWSSKSNGSSANSSTVYVDVIASKSSSSSSNTWGSHSTSASVDGSSQSNSGSFTLTPGGSITLLSKSYTVKHADNGSKSTTISVSVGGDVMWASGSANITLDTIPRASGIACSSPNIGDAATITIDRKSSSFTNTVTYQIGSLTGTIADKTSDTVLLFPTDSIKEQIYALIPNERKAQGTVYCTTYNGSTQIGDTQSATFNLYAFEDDCKPDISATIVDTNTSVTDITDKFIKYISKPKVTINATAKNSATITNYSINLNDGQTSNIQENTFDTIGSNKITVLATDSRSYSNSKEYELDIIDYIKLHINTISITRPEGTSNEAILNADGVYFNGSFTDDVSNTLIATFKYRKSDDTDWIDGGSITSTIENNTFKFNDLSLGNIFDYNEEYQFKIILQDKFIVVGNLDADIITLPKGQEVITIGDNVVYIYGDLYLNDMEILEKVDYKDNEEIATNEYVNGKRVYAKRFTNIGLAANTLVQLKHSLTNCSEIWVDMTNSYVRSTNTDGRCFPLVQVYYTSTSSNSFFQVYVDDTNINLMSNGGWGTGWKISIVLKYTKK